jgi:hypothetical protein
LDLQRRSLRQTRLVSKYWWYKQQAVKVDAQKAQQVSVAVVATKEVATVAVIAEAVATGNQVVTLGAVATIRGGGGNRPGGPGKIAVQAAIAQVVQQRDNKNSRLIYQFDIKA